MPRIEIAAPLAAQVVFRPTRAEISSGGSKNIADKSSEMTDHGRPVEAPYTACPPQAVGYEIRGPSDSTVPPTHGYPRSPATPLDASFQNFMVGVPNMTLPPMNFGGHPMMNPNFQAHLAQSSLSGSNPMLCGADVGMHGGNMMNLPPLYPPQFVPNGINPIIANTDALYLMNGAANPGYTAVEPSMVTATTQPSKVKKQLGRPRKYCVPEADSSAAVSQYSGEAPRKRGSNASQTPLRSRLKPPKQSPSAWQIFFSEELQSIKANSPDERLNVAHLAKDAGARYAELPEWKRQEYQARSQEAKEQHERDLAEWRSKLTPEDIKQENAFRSAQRKLGKSRRGNLKDPNAPKKPLSAYFLYLRTIRKNPELCKEVLEGEHETTKQSVLAAAKWRSMSESEKQPYLIQAEKDKAEYERLRREYEVHCGKSRDGAALPSEHHDEMPVLLSDTTPTEHALNKTSYEQDVL